MYKIKIFVAAILSATLLSGCAQIKNVASGLDYSTGTYVTQQQIDSFKKGKTRQADVIAMIGNPPQRAEVLGKEVWTYTYTLIPALPFEKNKFENTVIEFNKRGVVVNAYKTGGAPGQSGNPLLNAAGM
ncbi:outer membrane protein assembly factor BamE [Stutzerimonas stutzeri]|uniref:outer membrane protein assembly factor BamE n=1 Tax=Stutzerimonas stutzeri TaxID=316 RepID=UPI001300C323|nr:outer membrane protein assembly factor BamE [Stutzerimonas stutzeri]